MLPPIDTSAFTLTLEQQLTHHHLRSDVSRMSRSDLEEAALELARQLEVQRNINRSLIKKAIAP